MKKIFFLLISLLILTYSVNAKYIWSERKGSWITDQWWNNQVFISDDGQIIQSTEFTPDGYVVRSEDGGETWNTILFISGDYNLYQAISSDGKKILLPLNSGLVVFSNDSGSTWQNKTNIGFQPVGFVMAGDGSRVIGLNNSKESIIYSTDDGDNWQQVTNFDIPTSFPQDENFAISYDGMKIMFPVYGSYVYLSTDGGQNFTHIENLGTSDWSGVGMSPDGTKLCAVGTNSVAYSYDSGITWNITSDVMGVSYLVNCVIGGDVIAKATGSNLMFISYDRGQTWSYEDIGIEFTYAMAMTPDASKIAMASDQFNIRIAENYSYPTLTELPQNPFEIYEAGCPVYVQSQNKIYDFCKNTTYRGLDTYDFSTQLWSDKGTVTPPNNYPHCEVYNENIYCMVFSPNNLKLFQYNYSSQTLDLIKTNTTDITTGVSYMSCDLRPNTDEIWCLTDFNNNVEYFKINLTTTDFSHEDTHLLSDQTKSCKFRNNDEIWCAFGDSSGGGLVSKYTISTKNVTEIDTNYDLIYMNCRWYQDNFYCYGGFDSGFNIFNDQLVVINPIDNSFGKINFTEWKNQGISVWDDSCIEIGNGDFCDIAYYDPINFFNSNQSYWVSWDGSLQPQPCTPDWSCTGYETCVSPMVNSSCNAVTDLNTCGDGYGGNYSEFTPQTCNYPPPITGYVPAHQTSDISGVVIDFGVEFGLQIIAFVGLIALVGIGIWLLSVI